MSRETAVVGARAAVYCFRGDRWELVDGGLSFVSLYYNPDNGASRVVASSISEEKHGQIVINCLLFPQITYQKATELFHQWADSRNAYGLNFATIKEASDFAEAIQSSLTNLRNAALLAAQTALQQQTTPAINSYIQNHQYQVNETQPTYETIESEHIEPELKKHRRRTASSSSSRDKRHKDYISSTESRMKRDIKKKDRERERERDEAERKHRDYSSSSESRSSRREVRKKDREREEDKKQKERDYSSSSESSSRSRREVRKRDNKDRNESKEIEIERKINREYYSTSTSSISRSKREVKDRDRDREFSSSAEKRDREKEKRHREFSSSVDCKAKVREDSNRLSKSQKREARRQTG
eukprot:TRINITY_DN26387_c0_g1_i1.p1 TRINITY_DN26387_c0_g1~~TRINITY_DN26387_c0_g1_i1.p1  ORF type:complete len:357 (-),score=77.38 TRINITY_DN26387_c0_g1_i1:58-1128(-)